MFGHSFFGQAYFGPSWFGPAAAGSSPPPAVVSTVIAGGFFFRKRRKYLEPEEALEIIEQEGTKAERLRAAELVTNRLLVSLRHAERELDAEKRARARAEQNWAIATAKRIARERDDEEAVAFALLLD